MYGIVAYCPRSGRIGAALSGADIGVGGRCLFVRPGVGLVAAAAPAESNRHVLALNLVAAGLTPRGALDAIARDHGAAVPQQLALLTARGDCAVLTDGQAEPWAGDRVVEGRAAFGAGIAGPAVIEAMLAGLDRDAGADLELRLVSALEAGRDAGGLAQAAAGAACSAVVSVWGRERFSDIDLRVDLHAEPVGELRSILEEYRPYIAYYLQRAESPRTLMPQEQFAAMHLARNTEVGQ